MRLRTAAMRWLLSVIVFSTWQCTVANTAGDGDVALDTEPSNDSLKLLYLPNLGYRIQLNVGAQALSLKLTSILEGIVLFEKGTDACALNASDSQCYDPKSSKTATWCNNDEVCVPGKNDFQCQEVKSHEYIATSTTTDFRAEGISHSMQTIEGFEKVSISNSELPEPVTFYRVPVKLAKKVISGSNLPLTADAGGFFGIAGASISCRQRSIWDELLVKHKGLYVLDLNGDHDGHNSGVSAESRIRLGTGSVNEDEVLWGEKRQVGGIFTDASIEFTAYEMSMCGVNLFGKTSGHWQVAIDVASQCLVLPRNFWLSLMAQLPMEDGCYDKKALKMCALRRGEATKLPAIEFKLHYQSNDQVIRIPLQNLLMDNGSSPLLCVVPDEDTPSPLIFTNHPSIKFGYKVMESLQAVVDTKGHRVGFVHKRPVETSNDICVPPVKCM
ncbi:erythrocyte membrane-associated antigen [Babesia ovata]|uniref:Erythrocyte membrane-associated antigen n=1 Tax=Babesia ovata TaxID=189622 RepID=A0A2H6KCY6_9APIC|nr:erythrocyte membrane-associated antigen [Babesia ovata]XP_028867099.1 erythrocyte membrane-associated antigen [Babesia ovata]GBE60853.1 erythrocyte membrane-associated antigen [Babesia ovata]GBE60856.1 erythrocyte membrane-associated antigen [Babesia ovata]